MKSKVITKLKERIVQRERLIAHYETKYFNLYMSAWKSKLPDQEKNFVLKQFWDKGSVMAIKPSGVLMFTKYTSGNWNLYDFPVNCKAVVKGEIPDVSGVTFVNMESCVIGYINESHSPVHDIVRGYIERMVEVDMTIQTNVFLHKIPFFANVDNADRVQVEDFLQQMFDNELAVFFNGSSPITSADTGAPYIIDKLYSYRISLENELLTYLGIDNNQQQDYERLTVDQVNANNALINSSKNSMQQGLDAFSKNCLDVLGESLDFEPAVEMVQSVHEEKPAEGDNDE